MRADVSRLLRRLTNTPPSRRSGGGEGDALYTDTRLLSKLAVIDGLPVVEDGLRRIKVSRKTENNYLKGFYTKLDNYCRQDSYSLWIYLSNFFMEV